MNPSKKPHLPSPFPKCKTKRLNSEQKKTIRGTFIAEVNIQDVCEPSNEDSWITESETNQTTGNDDVFKSTAASEAEEEIHSPTETFRRSEKQQDDAWSVSHMRENSIATPTKGTVDDILPSPKSCSRSDSEETPKNADRPAGPKILPVSPYIEELKNFSSMLPSGEIIQTVLEYDHEAGKESEIPQMGSQKHSKGIFDSTRIVDPAMSTTLPTRFEWCDLSSISGSTQSSQHVSTKKVKSSEKGILSKEFSGEISIPKLQRKKPSARVKHDIPKTIIEEALSSFAEGPTNNLLSVNQSKNINKTLLQDNTKEKFCDTPTGGTIHKFPKRDIFLQRKSRPKTNTEEITSQSRPLTKDSLKKKFPEKDTSITPDEPLDTTYIKTNETVKTPLQNIFSEIAGKSTGGPAALNKEVHKVKKTSATTLLKKPLFRRKEKSTQKCPSMHSSAKDSIIDFIVSTEHEESSGKHSSKISERNSQAGTDSNYGEDSWKTYAASKKMKRKTTSVKTLKPIEKELEEEIVSTPSSTTTTQDTIDYMDTSETERSNASSNVSESTEKFLKEIGLYESEQSTEAESSKLKKRKKNLKKRKFRKDTLEEKSLEVRLQEYKEYLKTIPIDDLSLKHRRDKETKHGV